MGIVFGTQQSIDIFVLEDSLLRKMRKIMFDDRSCSAAFEQNRNEDQKWWEALISNDWITIVLQEKRTVKGEKETERQR